MPAPCPLSASERSRRRPSSVCACACRAQPLPAGQSREWEDWEYSYVPLMSSFFILYGVAYFWRPHKNIQEWAHNEAVRREASEEEEE